MLLLLVTLIACVTANVHVESWVHSQAVQDRVAQEGQPIVDSLRRHIGKLEEHSYLLQQTVAREEVVNSIKQMIPMSAFPDAALKHLEAFKKTSTVSYEWLRSDDAELKYSWLLVERESEQEYSLTLATGRTEEIRLGTPLEALRVSFSEVESAMHFGQSAFAVLDSELPREVVAHMLDVVRFAEGRIMLGHSSPHKKALNMRIQKGKRIVPQIMAITGAIDAITNTWKGIVSAFGSSTTQTIERVIQLGFEAYTQKTQLLKALGVPKTDVPLFTNAVIKAMGIPDEPQVRSVFQVMQYTTTFTWVEDNFLYKEKANNNQASSFLCYKFGDAASSTADFLYVKVQSNFALADDYLYVTTAKSKLGGLFSSQKTKIERIPHSLSLQETQLLQTFFKVIGIGKLAQDLGVSFDWPDLPQ